MHEATRLALLRGINVGGHRKLPMVSVTEIFLGVGCAEVVTYVQSGNVVFEAPDVAPGTLGYVLEQAILDATGLQVPVMVRAATEWQAVVAGKPFVDDDPTKVHVAFLGAEPPPGAADMLRRAATGSEEFVLADRHVYLHLPGGMGRAGLPQAFASWKPPVTVRNWRTVGALLDLARGQGRPAGQ